MSELQPGMTQKREGQLRLPSHPGEAGAEWRAQRGEARRCRRPSSWCRPGGASRASRFLRGLRHEGAEQWPKGLTPTLGALDLPLLMLADGQGERHLTVALVAAVFVRGHHYPSC